MIIKIMSRPEYFSTDWAWDLNSFQMFSLDVILDVNLLFCRFTTEVANEQTILSSLNILVNLFVKVLFLLYSQRCFEIFISKYCRKLCRRIIDQICSHILIFFLNFWAYGLF